MAIFNLQTIERKRRSNSRFLERIEARLSSIRGDIRGVREEAVRLDDENKRNTIKQSFVDGLIRTYCSMIGNELYESIIEKSDVNGEMKNFLEVDTECLWLLQCLGTSAGLTVETICERALTAESRVRAFLRMALSKDWIFQREEDYVECALDNLANAYDPERKQQMIYGLTDTGETILSNFAVRTYYTRDVASHGDQWEQST